MRTSITLLTAIVYISPAHQFHLAGHGHSRIFIQRRHDRVSATVMFAPPFFSEVGRGQDTHWLSQLEAGPLMPVMLGVSAAILYNFNGRTGCSRQAI